MLTPKNESHKRKAGERVGNLTSYKEYYEEFPPTAAPRHRLRRYTNYKGSDHIYVFRVPKTREIGSLS